MFLSKRWNFIVTNHISEYHYKRVTLCVALQIMADVITVDNAITLKARKLGYVDVTEDQRYVVKQFLKGSDLFVSLPTGRESPSAMAASWAV